jgi:uncharacterized protein YhbP (UPF0306 family)
MKPEEIVKQQLPQPNIMQLATSADDKPWVCHIHYYSDEALNFYWVSTVERRHSQDIARNPQVAATILVHKNTPEENYAIGVSVEGTAELIGEQIDEKIGEGYIRKHGKDPSLLSDIASGKNPHKFYRLKPTRIVLFDSKNFPNDPRQEWLPNT